MIHESLALGGGPSLSHICGTRSRQKAMVNQTASLADRVKIAKAVMKAVAEQPKSLISFISLSVSERVYVGAFYQWTMIWPEAEDNCSAVLPRFLNRTAHRGP